MLDAAMRMLEAGEVFSLRALARESGVSPAAPYRHFADREALETALAAQGLRDLKQELMAGGLSMSSPADLGELAVLYVDFARRRPALFRLMYGNACSVEGDERTAAAAEIHALLVAVAQVLFPDSDPEALASAGWALAHGLACLHLEGKIPSVPPEKVDDHVRACFDAILTLNGT
jgi:AcrR family transcriptional regulator